ncbi:hypothetical protein B0O80DRAFT_474832 [Mortierella sp. GBAus27b]|nr:hypothetical protein B0O80DRAFT_474832 [Mortierella sp. GBAus27b]
MKQLHLPERGTVEWHYLTGGLDDDTVVRALPCGYTDSSGSSILMVLGGSQEIDAFQRVRSSASIV